MSHTVDNIFALDIHIHHMYHTVATRGIHMAFGNLNADSLTASVWGVGGFEVKKNVVNGYLNNVILRILESQAIQLLM